jgi:hypothetical protein
MSTTVAIPPNLRARVEKYRDDNNLGKTSIAARVLIEKALKQEASK